MNLSSIFIFSVQVMYTPDNKQLISCADDKTIRMWDTASGSETRKYGIPFQPLFYFLTSFLAVAPETSVVDPH
jgi:WD40 repeat protein